MWVSASREVRAGPRTSDAPSGVAVFEARSAREWRIIWSTEDGWIPDLDSAAVFEEWVEPLEEVVDPDSAAR